MVDFYRYISYVGTVSYVGVVKVERASHYENSMVDHKIL